LNAPDRVGSVVGFGGVGGESIRVKEGNAFKHEAVEGAGEEAVGDQDEEEEARKVLRLLLLMLQVYLLMMLILMVKDASEHVEEDTVRDVKEDTIKDKVVTLMREARVKRLILMLMLQLLMEWEEEVHRLTEGEAVKRLEEDEAVDCMEIVSLFEGVEEKDVED